jgi:hypothetical protein
MKWYTAGIMAVLGCLVALVIYGLVGPMVFGSKGTVPGVRP